MNSNAPPEYVSPWHEEEVTVAGTPVRVATRLDALAPVDHDPSRVLLAERMATLDALSVLDLECGPGLVGAVAARRAKRVVMTTRSVIAREAATRTLARNGIEGAEVRLANGAAGAADLGLVDAVALRLPKGKLPAMQLMWSAFHALAPDRPCLVAGANTEGIRSAARRLQRLFGNARVIAYGGKSRLVEARRLSEIPPDASEFDETMVDPDRFHSFDVSLEGRPLTIRSRPGVFCWDRVDEGSRALLDSMEIGRRDRVLDLGCGCGVLTAAAALRASEGNVTGVDVDVEAVRSARATLSANGLTNCTIVSGDGGAALEGSEFDTVVTNPPVHFGRQARFDTAVRFFRDAASLLRPGGTLQLVANRTLPYERTLREIFPDVRLVLERAGFKVLFARR